MDWRDLAGVIAPMAPTLGRLLGDLSPVPGGGFVGQWAGELLARKLGVPASPEAVSEVLNTTPVDTPQAAEVMAQIQQAESEAVAKWNAMVQIAQSESSAAVAGAQAVNETMRAEVTAKIAWWHWRHLLGYVICAWYVVPLPGIGYAFFTGDPAVIGQLVALLGAMSAFILTGSALLGAVAIDTTRFKQALSLGIPQSFIPETVKKVLGRK